MGRLRAFASGPGPRKSRTSAPSASITAPSRLLSRRKPPGHRGSDSNQSTGRGEQVHGNAAKQELCKGGTVSDLDFGLLSRVTIIITHIRRLITLQKLLMNLQVGHRRVDSRLGSLRNKKSGGSSAATFGSMIKLLGSC